MKTNTKTAIDLQDGNAHHMGDGVFVLLQRDERAKPQSVVVTERDLRELLGALGAYPQGHHRR